MKLQISFLISLYVPMLQRGVSVKMNGKNEKVKDQLSKRCKLLSLLKVSVTVP